MKIIERFENRFDHLNEQVTEYLDRLSTRERVMVIFTTIFVVVAAIGSTLWYMHKAAEKQQNRVNELKELVTWMQSSAVTMKPSEEGSLSISDKVQRAAQSQGLSVSAQENAGKIQILATHENYAVLGNFITELAQLGLSIEKMALISENGQIKLTATVM